MDDNELAFRATFRQTLETAKHLVMRSVPAGDGLRQLLAYALNNQRPSGYPFVLRYAFCRREGDGAKILKIAAAVHLLQQSSVITDDIFDHGELRYGDSPLYLEYDVNYAIIAAELLQTIALHLISEELAGTRFCNPAIASKVFNQILLDGYVGQYLDLFNSARPTVTLRDYYRMIALSAGYFFQNVARCGALLAGKPEEEVRILCRFAYNYGMALFILDDVTDTLPARQTEKTYASDLKGRRMHLPLIMALKLANRTQRQSLQHFLRNKVLSQRRIVETATLLRQCGALESGRRVARRYLSASLRSLSQLPAGISAKRLRWLAQRLYQLL